MRDKEYRIEVAHRELHAESEFQADASANDLARSKSTNIGKGQKFSETTDESTVDQKPKEQKTITIQRKPQQLSERDRKLRLEMINDIIMQLITEHNYGEKIPVNKNRYRLFLVPFLLFYIGSGSIPR